MWASAETDCASESYSDDKLETNSSTSACSLLLMSIIGGRSTRPSEDEIFDDCGVRVRRAAVPPRVFSFCMFKNGQHTHMLERLYMQSCGTRIYLQCNSEKQAVNQWDACAGKMKQQEISWGSGYIPIQNSLSRACRCYGVRHLQMQLRIACLCIHFCLSPAFSQTSEF